MLPHQLHTVVPPAARPASKLALEFLAAIVACIAAAAAATAFAIVTSNVDCCSIVAPPLAVLLVALACVSERSAPSDGYYQASE